MLNCPGGIRTQGPWVAAIARVEQPTSMVMKGRELQQKARLLYGARGASGLCPETPGGGMTEHDLGARVPIRIEGPCPICWVFRRVRADVPAAIGARGNLRKPGIARPAGHECHLS